jgi:hypothetical protein
LKAVHVISSFHTFFAATVEAYEVTNKIEMEEILTLLMLAWTDWVGNMDV